MSLLKLLSETERKQLAKSKIGKSGKPCKYNYVNESEWIVLREYLLSRSYASNPLLNSELTAYTPGETLNLLEHPIVKNWHNYISNFKVPDNYKIIALIPCAKTKPWLNAKKGSYVTYNYLREMTDFDGVLRFAYFVTLSEPLGVVPQSEWASFPQYDNPGLFSDLASRSGMFKADWLKSPLAGVREMPFDEEAHSKSIERLGSVIANFLIANEDKRIVSFIEDLSTKGTHSQMLNVALKYAPGVMYTDERFFKKEKARDHSWAHIFRKIHSIYWDDWKTKRWIV